MCVVHIDKKTLYIYCTAHDVFTALIVLSFKRKWSSLYVEVFSFSRAVFEHGSVYEESASVVVVEEVDK